MKLALSATTLAFAIVANAENYNDYASNQNAQNYNDDASNVYSSDNGYYDEDGNWVSNYVQDMNEEDGNFQYYDEDGEYDEDYEVVGYYDEDGNFIAYDYDGDIDYVDDAAAEEYYDEWQDAGGASGYYDNEGDWNENEYGGIPCQGYSSPEAYEYLGEANYGSNQAWEQDDADDDQVYTQDLTAYMEACEENLDVIVENCEKSVIEVESVTMLCNSPYRYYYGNGGHMASELCEYGDQATVIVQFNVLQSVDFHKNMYMTMGIYSGKQTKELLWAVRSVELCQTFVGKNCEQQGSYGFAFDVTFEKISSDPTLFVPQIEIGFSTARDEGYNLGGVNINCQFNARYQQYNPTFNGATAHASQLWGAGGLGVAAGRYGFLICLALLGIAFGLFKYTRMQQGIEFQGNADELIDEKLASSDEKLATTD